MQPQYALACSLQICIVPQRYKSEQQSSSLILHKVTQGYIRLHDVFSNIIYDIMGVMSTR